MRRRVADDEKVLVYLQVVFSSIASRGALVLAVQSNTVGGTTVVGASRSCHHRLLQSAEIFHCLYVYEKQTCIYNLYTIRTQNVQSAVCIVFEEKKSPSETQYSITPENVFQSHHRSGSQSVNLLLTSCKCACSMCILWYSVSRNFGRHPENLRRYPLLPSLSSPSTG